MSGYESLHHDFSKEAELRNELISKELDSIKKRINIRFVTPSIFE